MVRAHSEDSSLSRLGNSFQLLTSFVLNTTARKEFSTDI